MILFISQKIPEGAQLFVPPLLSCSRIVLARSHYPKEISPGERVRCSVPPYANGVSFDTQCTKTNPGTRSHEWEESDAETVAPPPGE